MTLVKLPEGMDKTLSLKLRKATSEELAVWQKGWKEHTAEWILAEKEWQRRFIAESAYWQRMATYGGVDWRNWNNRRRAYSSISTIGITKYSRTPILGPTTLMKKTELDDEFFSIQHIEVNKEGEQGATFEVGKITGF